MIIQLYVSNSWWKSEGKLSLFTRLKKMGGVDIWLQLFLISTLDVGEWSGSRTGRFKPSERSRRYLLKGRMVKPQSLTICFKVGKSVAPAGKRTTISKLSSRESNCSYVFLI
jgi:hypothetical protein